MGQERRYPIGMQTFSEIRRRECVYIDKTGLIYDLVTSDKIYFLSRPRRFGKSLLVTTLEAYFSGRKELFRGLAMESLEKDWTEYPVLHFDFSGTKYFSTDDLSEQLDIQLSRLEEKYGKGEGEVTPAGRFGGIIRRAYEKTGRQVVFLVDEYDAPLLDSNGNPELQEKLRNMLRSFYSVVKMSDAMLRFVF
ncbi:MAG: AAA family ATPase, partial [Bacteroidetes bacterium]|nr:AAA family ATPase [Candidatus Cryptobacteroides avicola]